MAKKAKVVSFTVPEFDKVKIPQLIMPVLIVVAFIWLGILTFRVLSLEGQGGNNQAAVPSQQAAQATPAPGQKVTVGLGNFPVLGNKDAKVTIVEFADFRCPFCEQFFTNTESQIIKNYVDTGKVKFAFRNYAFLGPASIVAADAAECANDQGKFWAYHDYLYKNQPPETDTSMYNTDTLTQAAVSLGMNGTQFSNCLSNKTDEAKANQDLADGQKAGVSGTPTFIVNGIPLVGAQPYSAFQTAIDQALASAK